MIFALHWIPQHKWYVEAAIFDMHLYCIQLATLSARTGCHTALITVRGDLDHYNRPYVYLSDDRVGDFFQLALKETPSNFATRLEGYCTSGVTGMNLFIY
jgi:hypothetical protein